MIPKIIHQIAPSDKTKWHPNWESIREDCRENLKDYKFYLWNDDTTEKFTKKYYPRFLSLIEDYPFTINKVDMFRYMLLHRYGGIYMDMDFIFYKDFHDQLPSGLSAMESPYPTYHYQNSMIISEKSNDILLRVLEKANQIWKSNHHGKRVLVLNKDNSPNVRNIAKHILNLTGPGVLQSFYPEINQMKKENFVDCFDHAMTGHWT